MLRDRAAAARSDAIAGGHEVLEVTFVLFDTGEPTIEHDAHLLPASSGRRRQPFHDSASASNVMMRRRTASSAMRPSALMLWRDDRLQSSARG